MHAKYRAARRRPTGSRSAERDRVQREDLLRFQVRELDAARLQDGEEDALRAELRRLQHAERFNAGLAECAALLDEAPQSAAERLARAARVVQDLSRLDPAFGLPGEAIENARIQLDEALGAIRRLRDGVSAEPGRLDAIHERLDALARLKRKYGDRRRRCSRFRAEAARRSRADSSATTRWWPSRSVCWPSSRAS